MQQDVEGVPGWTADPPGQASVPSGSVTFTIPSAGNGAYALRFFRNVSSDAEKELAPPPIPLGGAIVASYAFTLGSSSSTATFTFDGDGAPPDQGQSVAGDRGLVCAAGTYSIYAGTGWPPCAQCRPGTYAPLDGSTGCAVCNGGTYSVVNGSSVCDNCPAEQSLLSNSLNLQVERDVCIACKMHCCDLMCPTPFNSTAARTMHTSHQPLHTTSARVTSLVTGNSAQLSIKTSSAATTSVASKPSVTASESYVCGDGIVETYPTSCWTDDRGGGFTFSPFAINYTVLLEYL